MIAGDINTDSVVFEYGNKTSCKIRIKPIRKDVYEIEDFVTGVTVGSIEVISRCPLQKAGTGDLR